ncbi:MAG: succinate dehydrogenase cytochrome b subunit [bacterium]|nr:succinate dehydrogenase cytochrome b subunit [bacterium]
MAKFSSVMWSSIGKKILMGLTGLGLCIFILEHMLGNLLLLLKNSEPFNEYAHFLLSFGELLYIAEAGLVAFFLIHIISGISVALGKRKARPVAYYKEADAGGASRKNIASVSMIYTGVILFIFLVMHIKTFKFGPGIAEGYVVQINGENARDLYRLVYEVFSNGFYVFGYVLMMIGLGSHLSHGFWSAFQSLGINHPRYTLIIYTIGILFALAMALGFIILPIWIYFTGGTA